MPVLVRSSRAERTSLLLLSFVGVASSERQRNDRHGILLHPDVR